MKTATESTATSQGFSHWTLIVVIHVDCVIVMTSGDNQMPQCKLQLTLLKYKDGRLHLQRI